MEWRGTRKAGNSVSRLRQSSKDNMMAAGARVVGTDSRKSSEREKIRILETSWVCTREVNKPPLLLGKGWK